MKYHNLIQGSAEWHALRSGHFTASEAPAMMGASPKVTRTELLNMKVSGTEREFSDWVQRNLFDKGHEYEASARPIVEELIDEELFPVTGTKEIKGLQLLASFDGLTMLGDTNFEHKMWNESLAQRVRDHDLPDEYKWQLDQQMLVSGAERSIFVVSDGTRENLVWTQYKSSESRFNQLIAGWRQFAEDLAGYAPTEAKAEAVGRTPENLPALLVELRGSVVSNNLPAFKEHAFAVIESLKGELVTDQDFADAEQQVKWCLDIEQKIKAAKEHGLSQMGDVYAVLNALDDVGEAFRQHRLSRDREVKAEKDNRRKQIRLTAENNFAEHLQALNKRLGLVLLPEINCDIIGAMRGKRTMASLEDAANTEVANAKVHATQIAESMEQNLKTIDELGGDHRYLFADKQSLALRDPEELRSLISARIVTHKAETKAKAEAERNRIQREEETKAQAAVKPAVAPKPEPVQQPAKAAAPIKDNPAPWELEQEAVTVRLSEYLRLQASDDMLQALIAAGVDGWDGWGEACALMRENAEATA